MNRFKQLLLSAVAIAVSGLSPVAFAQSQPAATRQSRQTNFMKVVEKMRGGNAALSGGGTTTVDLNDLQMRPRNIMKANAENPKGDVYGIIPTYRNASGYSDALYAKINLKNGKVTNVYRNPFFTIGEEYNYQGGTVRDGIVYIPNFTTDMVTGESSFYWKRFDLENGQQLSNISFGQNYDSFCYSLTYDSYKDRFYGLSINAGTGMMGQLVEVNPADWSLKSINNVGGSDGNCMVAIAFNPADGNLYGLKDNGAFYEISAANGSITVVREFDDWDEYYLFPTEGTPQALVYSPIDHAFVTIYRDGSEQNMKLAYIDCENGDFEPMLGATLSDVYFVASLVCTDQYADDAAPSIPEIKSIEFNGASLTGTVTFVAPKVTYNELAITAPFNAEVTVDGISVYSGTVKAGEEVKTNLTLAEGLHEVKVTCKIGDKTGPSASKKVYVGNDAPLAPTNVAINGDKVTWKKCTDKGQHDGYVDATKITYDVYVDGVKQNSGPLTENSFVLTPPAVQKRVDITVTATANNQTSLPSAALSTVIGKAFTLPQSYKPTAAQFALFQSVDANLDNNAFRFYTKDGVDYFAIGTEQYYQMPDDYLFFPKMNFPNADCQYNLSFMYSSFYGGTNHYDSMKIYLVSAPTLDAVDDATPFYSHEGRLAPEPVQINANFVVPAAGDYYIVVYAHGGDKGSYRGVKFNDVTVNSLAGSSVKAPGIPADVVLKGAPNGELKAIAEFTAPTVDLKGNKLDASSKLTFTAVCGENKSVATGTPGQKVSLSVAVDKDGFSTVTITPSNAYGNGVSKSYDAYVGLDAPLAPINIKGVPSDDNMSLVLTWDMPLEGVNGGYVDPAGLTYDIYVKNSAANYTKVGSTSENTFTYVPASPSQAPTFVGPVAVNKLGQSKYSQFVYEYVGQPLELPYIEEFPATSGALTLWRYSTESPYSQEMGWSVISSLSGLEVGSAIVNEGAMFANSLVSSPVTGRLMGPKVSTADVKKASVDIKYLNYRNAAKMVLYARSSKRPETFRVSECSPTGGMMGEWAHFETPLTDDLLDCGWVQFYIDVTLGSASNAYFFMDSFAVNQDYDYDFKVKSIEGTELCSVGEDAQYSIIASNSGLEAATAQLSVKLFGDGKQVTEQVYSIGRTLPGRDFQKNVEIPMLQEYLQYKTLEVVATVVAEKDELAKNNSKSIGVKLRPDMGPVVTDLKAEWTDEAHNAVRLNWSKPAAEYGNQDGFEYSPSFELTDRIGQWKNIDLDGLPQFVFSLGTMRWEGDDEPSAWTVYNAEELGMQNEERLKPHSGKQYLMARSIAYDPTTEKPVQNNDWLISPEVVGGTKVSFWMNILDTQYKETIEVWTSSTDDNPESFVKLRNFTKSGTEGWEFNEFKLPSSAKYFALVYKSWGQFGACVDDIEFTPKTLNVWAIDSYNVWRESDGKSEKVASKLTDLTYLDNNLTDRAMKYNVTCNFENDGVAYEGVPSNAARVWQTGINDLITDGSVYGEKGAVVVCGHSGSEVAVYAADGKYVSHVVLSSDRQRISLDAGIYMVKVGSVVAKVIVK